MSRMLFPTKNKYSTGRTSKMNYKGGSNFKRDMILPLLECKPHDKYELSEKIGISHVTIKGYISRLNQERNNIIQLHNSKYELIPPKEIEFEY